MTCAETCGPRPSCMKYLAKVQTVSVPSTPKHLSKEERDFWDPPNLDQFALAMCDNCSTTRVDYNVPRFYWSPNYDEPQTRMVSCKRCSADVMISRRFHPLTVPRPGS